MTKKPVCKKRHFPDKREADIYDALKVWGKTEKPLIIVWYLLNAQILESTAEGDIWAVPSFSGDETHKTDLIRGVCTCMGFLRSNDNDCSHLRAMRLRSVVQHKPLESETEAG